MSRSLDLFIRRDTSLAAVASEIRRITGIMLSERPEERDWVLRDVGVEAYLSEHRYLDDGDLPLGQYRYCLTVTVADMPKPADSVGAGFLRQLGEHLRRGGIACLLVIDLQHRDPLAPTGAYTAHGSESGT